MATMTDNATHHLITTNGATRCAYCKKTSTELGPDATQQACPSAPR